MNSLVHTRPDGTRVVRLDPHKRVLFLTKDLSAIRKCLDRAKLAIGDVDRIEINEAFAAQYLGCEKELELDRAKVNVNGGAIALGHPLGATGTRLVLTLMHELRRAKLRYGIASACIGGGQGIAILIENAAL